MNKTSDSNYDNEKDIGNINQTQIGFQNNKGTVDNMNNLGYNNLSFFYYSPLNIQNQNIPFNEVNPQSQYFCH